MSLLILLGGAGTVRQFLRPISDYSAGGWTPSTGSALWAMLDETTFSDADYVQSGNAPSNDVAIVKLSSVPTPVSGIRTLRVRIDKDPDGATRQDFTVTLLQGPGPGFVDVQSQTATDVGDSFTTYSLNITGAITDYAECYVKLSANQP